MIFEIKIIFIKPRWYIVSKMFSKLLKIYKINFKSRYYHLAHFTRKYLKGFENRSYRLARFTRKSFEAVRLVWDLFSIRTICMVFLVVVDVGCHTVGGETIDPLCRIVTRLVGSLLVGLSVKRL